MQRVNFIPAQRINARRRRIRIRFWSLVLGGYATCLVVVCVLARTMLGADHGAMALELESIRAASAKSNADLAIVRKQISQAQRTAKMVRIVTDQPDWSQLLLAIGQRVGDEAVLKELRLTPVAPEAVEASPANRPAGKTDNDGPAPARLKLELRGLARSQAQVSQFVDALEKAGVFEGVKLIRTGREPFLASTAVNFDIECRLGD